MPSPENVARPLGPVAGLVPTRVAPPVVRLVTDAVTVAPFTLLPLASNDPHHRLGREGDAARRRCRRSVNIAREVAGPGERVIVFETAAVSPVDANCSV